MTIYKTFKKIYTYFPYFLIPFIINIIIIIRILYCYTIKSATTHLVKMLNTFRMDFISKGFVISITSLCVHERTDDVRGNVNS